MKARAVPQAQYRIYIFQIRPEMDLVGFVEVNLAKTEAGFARNLTFSLATVHFYRDHAYD